jgi:predicted DNA-binding transcriptional regulator AlpA
MHKVGEVANKIVVSNSNYKLVQIKKNEQFIYNKFKSLNIISENKLEVYKESPNFTKLVNTDDQILKHPTFAKKIGETEKSIVYKIVTISHSPKPIKINEKKVEKEIISYYYENGQRVAQYATKAY